jgi:hypothetical protein
MKTYIRNFIVGAGILVSGLVHGAAPVTLGGPTTGLWWNPNEAGRGYNIDIQDNTMVVTTFIYQQNGAPIWYLSSGTFDESTGVFNSSYDAFSGGQCFGCVYTFPTVYSGAGGPMTIAFHNNVTATLYYPGGSMNIVKYLYGFSSPASILQGEWSFSFNTGGLVNGDWVIFNQLTTDQSGNVYATGADDGPLSEPAVGTYNASADAFFVVVTQGPFQHAYKVTLDDRRGLGSAWVVPTGTQVSGNGSAAYVARILFADQVAAALGGEQAKKLLSARPDQSALVSSGDRIDPADGEVITRLQEVASGARVLSVATREPK